MQLDQSYFLATKEQRSPQSRYRLVAFAVVLVIMIAVASAWRSSSSYALPPVLPARAVYNPMARTQPRVAAQGRPTFSAVSHDLLRKNTVLKAQTTLDLPSRVTDPDAWVSYLTLSGQMVEGAEKAVHKGALESVQKYFPGALPDSMVHARIIRSMQEQVPNFRPEKTLVATSFCPDEICYERGDLPTLLQGTFGTRFDMSGLAGVPFVGKTGFKAFASHIPDDGDVLITFGPHVAISPDGQVGMAARPHQAHLTAACGACIGGFAAAESGAPRPEAGTDGYEDDYQFVILQRELAKREGAINNHPGGKMVGLPYAAYEIAEQQMRNTIQLEVIGKSKLVLLGGIQINMPDPLPDFFLPLSFQMLTAPQPLMNYLSAGNK